MWLCVLAGAGQDNACFWYFDYSQNWVTFLLLYRTRETQKTRQTVRMYAWVPRGSTTKLAIFPYLMWGVVFTACIVFSFFLSAQGNKVAKQYIVAFPLLSNLLFFCTTWTANGVEEICECEHLWAFHYLRLEIEAHAWRRPPPQRQGRLSQSEQGTQAVSTGKESFAR